jgi:integrase
MTQRPKRRLLDQVRDAIRLKHYAYSTEKAYVYWAKRFILYQLLYGSGLRLMECMRLRVKDLDFGHHQIIVRDAKGGKDRLTILPDSVIEPLRIQLAMAKQLHEQDLAKGYGAVYLPYALERKYPNAHKEWI